MSTTKTHDVLDSIRPEGSRLAAAVWDDDGYALLAHWREGAPLEGGLASSATAVATKLGALCQTRIGAESVGAALPAELADVVMVWAASVAKRADLVLSPLVTASSMAVPKLQRSAARERVLHGALFDALHSIAGVWGDHDHGDHLVRHRIDQLIWEAGARGLTLASLGRWAWSTPSVVSSLILERATGHLGDRVRAARALAILADGFDEDRAPALAHKLLATAQRLFEDPEPAVWTAAARGLGRLTRGSRSALLLLFQLSSDDKRIDRKRRSAAAIASLPFEIGTEGWIEQRLDAILTAEHSDPWQLAAVAVAAPHLARERPDLWFEICARTLGSQSLELGWTLAQGLAMLARHSAGRRSGDRRLGASEEQVARQLRDKLTTRVMKAESEHGLRIEALLNLDRALGLPPSAALCVDQFDARIQADVEGVDGLEPTVPRVAFDEAVSQIADGDTETRSRAQLAMRSAMRAQAMHLTELVLGLPTRAADSEAMAARASVMLANEACSYGLRASLVGVLADLVNAEPIERPDSTHGRASARALRGLAASRWMREVAAADAKDSKARSEIKRFRKPLEDLFDSCMASHPTLVAHDVTIPPVIAAWWALCAGPGFALSVIERSGDHHGLADRVAELEAALGAGASTPVATWGPRAIAALEALGAKEIVLGEVFVRLVHVLMSIEQAATLAPAEAKCLLAELAVVARALVAVGDDLDDALAPAMSFDALAVSAGDFGPYPGTAMTNHDDAARSITEWAHQLGPALRALVLPAARSLEARVRGEAAFVAKQGVAFGNYTLIRKVGAGAMGEVWHALRKGKQPVALKIPKQNVSAEIREALAAALNAEAAHFEELSIANLATYLDHGVIDGVPFLATEFIRGHTLHDHFITDPRADPAGKHFPLVQRVVEDICIGLDDLHGHHIVHRDLKPSNVMLRMRGREPALIKSISDDPTGKEVTEAMLIDLGISHGFNAQGDRGWTPGYAAPEVVGEEAVGPQADIYALGATLFHILTRYRFAQDKTTTAAMLTWHGFTDPFTDPHVVAASKGLPTKIRDTLANACRLDPTDRLTIEQFRAGICEA